MAEKYSKNYVFFLIVIAIIVLMAIFWYAFNKPVMTAIGDNQTPYVCKEGQNCSLQSTPDSSKENLTAAQKKMSTDLLQFFPTRERTNDFGGYCLCPSKFRSLA